jgi:hypothetical protein
MDEGGIPGDGGAQTGTLRMRGGGGGGAREHDEGARAARHTVEGHARGVPPSSCGSKMSGIRAVAQRQHTHRL